MPMNDPFDYLPHGAVVAVAEQVVAHLDRLALGSEPLRDELSRGKMLGVLIVSSDKGDVGSLWAFSGSIAGQTQLGGFVPPIYDLDVEGGYFREQEGEMVRVSEQILLAEQRYESEEYESLRKEA